MLGAVDVSVNSLTTNTAGGNQFISESNDLAIGLLNAGGGEIALAVSGALTHAAAARDVRLRDVRGPSGGPGRVTHRDPPSHPR